MHSTRPRNWLLPLSLLALTAAAQAAEETQAPLAPSREVAQALEPLIAEYGVDAVNLQGNLLRHAITAGSLLEASSGIGGLEPHENVDYLVFRIQTGLAYNDPEVLPATRPLRIWQDVVEPALRPCKRLQLPAPGIRLEISYWHADFENRSDLARAVRAGTAVLEAASFRILARDVVEFAHDRITAQDLASRAAIEIAGAPFQLQIPPPQPTRPD